LTDDVSDEVKEEYVYRQQLESWRQNLLERHPEDSAVASIIQKYFSIGADTSLITDSSEDLDASPDFPELVRLLFGHPLWSVAESTASVVAEIVAAAHNNGRDDRVRHVVRIIDNLNGGSHHWRVRYGAIEAAFQIRHEDGMESFGKAVEHCFKHRCSKIRGLCAENIFSVMLNQSNATRDELIKRFKPAIEYWLKDEDCWVLEHVYRLFRQLDDGGVNVKPMLERGVSRLMDGEREWYTMPREKFLRYIEERKEELLLDREVLANAAWNATPISQGGSLQFPALQ
jgi:hypothetical protein